MKKGILGVVGILIILVAIFLLQSAPIDPAAYPPPKAPELSGALAPNNLLQKAELLARGRSMARKRWPSTARDGFMAGPRTGRSCACCRMASWRSSPNERTASGPPVDKNESLIVCDAYKDYSPSIPREDQGSGRFCGRRPF